MPKVPRSLYWQAAALLLVIALVWALSRFFPVVEFIAVLQQRVMSSQAVFSPSGVVFSSVYGGDF